MTNYYELIAASVTAAIETMADGPRDTVLCPASEVQALAAYVFLSWLQSAGQSAKRSDAKIMAGLIVGML
jgi:hypothetical protein